MTLAFKLSRFHSLLDLILIRWNNATRGRPVNAKVHQILLSLCHRSNLSHCYIWGLSRYSGIFPITLSEQNMPIPNNLLLKKAHTHTEATISWKSNLTIGDLWMHQHEGAATD